MSNSGISVLVSGANGHIGSNLTELLCLRGFDVRALVRPSADTKFLESLGIEIYRGDVTSSEDYIRATKGIQYVYHLAAPTLITQDISKIVRLGLENLINAAKVNHIKKVVYTSTAVTIGFSPSPNIVLNEESAGYYIPASSYHSEKHLAEQQLMAMWNELPFSLVIVNPSSVVGRYDFKTTPSSMPSHLARSKMLNFWFSAGVTVANARGVAEGHINAMEYGRRANRYILGGENLEIREYFDLLNNINNRVGPFLQIPDTAMKAAGILFSGCQNLGFKKVPFDYQRIKSLLGNYGFYSSDKAINEIGYSIRTARESVLDYYNWLDLSIG